MSETVETARPNMETTSALPPEETERLGGEIVAALKTVFDPEIPADIYELGLIYKVDIKDDRTVDVEMTLTTPNFPAAAGGQRSRRRPGQRQHRVGTGLDAGPHDRRGASCFEYVVMRSSCAGLSAKRVFALYDPRIHHSSTRLFRRGWIAGSSPAMTKVEQGLMSRKD